MAESSAHGMFVAPAIKIKCEENEENRAYNLYFNIARVSAMKIKEWHLTQDEDSVRVVAHALHLHEELRLHPLRRVVLT